MKNNPIKIDDDNVYIVAAGAQTPVGRNYRSAAAAVRCGISAYAEHPFMIDRYGEPMVVARADWLDETLPAAERICQLGEDAITEALSEQSLGSLRIRLHLALPAELLSEAEQQAIGRKILEKVAPLAAGAPRIVADGHAAGMMALESAVKEVRSGQAQLSLIGGIDSYMDPVRLETIDYAGRLHSINNSWGFTPGEGAGFLLIAGGRTIRSHGLTPLAVICAVATSNESKLLGTKTVCIGEGLTAAFRGALSETAKVAESYCDLNGETYRADEFGFAVCRTSDSFEDAGKFTAAAQCWGDVGAASAPLSITLALAAWMGNYAQGDQSLVWCSSAHAPARGAARLQTLTPSEN